MTNQPQPGKPSQDQLSQLQEVISENINAYVDQGMSETEKGERWLIWVQQHYFNRSEEEANNALTGASGDCHVDAFFKAEDDTIIILQGKYGSAHTESAFSIFKDGVEKLRKNSIDKFPERIKEAVIALQDPQKEVEIYYATNQIFSDPHIEGIRVLDLYEITKEIDRRKRSPMQDQKAELKYKVKLDYGNLNILIVSLKAMKEFMSKTNEYIFASNIRQFQSDKTIVNKKIKETITSSPEKFLLFNNGITIVATSYDFPEKEKKVDLFEPQIINGAQTSSIIADPSVKTNLDSGDVTVTLLKEKDDKVIQDITRYRNSQNAVKGKDLVSLVIELDEIRTVLEQLRDPDNKKGFFFEVQPGAFETMKKGQRREYKGKANLNKYFGSINDGYCIYAKDAIQSCAAALLDKPEEAYSNAALFMPNGSEYHNLFPAGQDVHFKKLLVPYLIRQYCKSVLGYGRRITTDPVWQRRGTIMFIYFAFGIFKRIYGRQVTDPPSSQDIDNMYRLLDDDQLGIKWLRLTHLAMLEFSKQCDVVVDMSSDPENFFKNKAKNHRKEMNHVISWILANTDEGKQLSTSVIELCQK